MTILLISILALALYIAIPLVILYATVRFIKWAWYAGSNKPIGKTFRDGSRLIEDQPKREYHSDNIY